MARHAAAEWRQLPAPQEWCGDEWEASEREVAVGAHVHTGGQPEWGDLAQAPPWGEAERNWRETGEIRSNRQPQASPVGGATATPMHSGPYVHSCFEPEEWMRE